MRRGTLIRGLSTIGVVMAVAVTTPASAQQYYGSGGGYGPHGMMGYGGGWGSAGPMMLFGGFFWLLLLALGVLVVVWIVRGSSHGGHYPLRSNPRSSGLDILEERYAKGEVQRDEYLQKKRDLGG